MTPADLDALLRQTLADHKLSGSEKQLLAGFGLNHIGSDQDRAVARSRAFAVARQAAADEEAQRLLVWLEDVLKVLTPLGGGSPPPAPDAAPDEAFFSPGDECLGRIVHRFAVARRTADVCVFTITDDRIAAAILHAHRRGVRVRVVTDNEKAFDAGSDVERLEAAGVAVRTDRSPYHMHHKFALFDDARLLNGSYNWTRGAARDNEENLVDTGDPRLLAAFRRQFDELWARLG